MLSHLRLLEAESISIIREAVAESERIPDVEAQVRTSLTVTLTVMS